MSATFDFFVLAMVLCTLSFVAGYFAGRGRKRPTFDRIDRAAEREVIEKMLSKTRPHEGGPKSIP